MDEGSDLAKEFGKKLEDREETGSLGFAHSRLTTGLFNLSDDALLCVTEKLDVPSLLGLGIAGKVMHDFVHGEAIWLSRCRKWATDVDLGFWRSQLQSAKALYRLLNALSKLVGSWKLISTDPRGEILYATWGKFGVEVYKVVPDSAEDAKLPVSFLKFLDVHGSVDGSYTVKVNRGVGGEGANIFPRSLQTGDCIQLELYHGPSEMGSRIHQCGDLLRGTTSQFSLNSVPAKKEQVQTRVYKKLTFDKPRPGQELAGLWTGFYFVHGWEILTVAYSETENGVEVKGTKVLGDVHVPSGKGTFKANMSLDITEDGEGKKYLGHGRIADENFMNAEWIQGELLVLNRGGFRFFWTGFLPPITYQRLDLEALFRYNEIKYETESSGAKSD